MATGIKRELGVTGLSQYNGSITESWIADLRSNAAKVRVYDEMSRLDSVGAAMLQTTSVFMQGAKIHVKAAGELPEDIEKAEFLETALTTMIRPFEEIIADIVYFLVYGWFACEIVYEQRDDKRIYWKKWAPRHPVTLDRWEIKDGEFTGMWQNWQSTTVLIPAEKMLHFSTTGAGKGNFEGVSIFEGSYTSWFFVKNLQILEAIICERMSGTPVISLPENVDFSDTSDNSPVAKARNIVRNIKVGEDMGMTLPAGWTFKYEMPTSGPAIDLGNVISRHQKDFARVLLMDFIMIGAGDGGSFSMIKDKSAMYLAALNTFLAKIASVINRQAVTRLFELNSFPEGSGLPTTFFDKLSKVDLADFADMVAKLFNAGSVTYDLATENQVRRMIGLEQISQSGLLLKPNLPAKQGVSSPQEQAIQNVPDETNPISLPEEQQVETEKPAAATTTSIGMDEFSDTATAKKIDAIVTQAGNKLSSLYSRILKPLTTAITPKNESEWEDIIDRYLKELSEQMRETLLSDITKMWRDVTGDNPTTPELALIVNEVMEQYGFMNDVLTPTIREKILEIAKQAKDDDLSAMLFALSIGGATGLFTARAGTYANSIYKIYGNYATPVKAKHIFDNLFPNNSLTLDIENGLLHGDNILARNISIEDNRVCPDCIRLSELGWTNPENLIPHIGERQCKHNDRCYIQYKYRGRIA